ncbi:MAG: hypothetical protein H8E35_05860, partial [Ardenticatenia bacterium]|nr:hypothetical protein [Ardenticatenia bacterium]
MLTLALTVFAVAPLTYPGYLQVHSGFVPAYNLADLASRPLDLRWTPSVATSFDPLRGDGLLPYYLALPVVWVGGTPLQGVKIVLGLSILLGAIGVYLWLRRPLGPAGATLAALVYTYLPYRIAVVTVRGAWGEALFLGLLPLAIVAATSWSGGRLSLRVVTTVLLWTVLGLSQPGLSIWAFLFLVAWFLLLHSGRVPACQAPWPVAGALFGTAPAVLFTLWAARWVLVKPPIVFGDHFLHPAQLLSPYWGFGASRPGWDDGLTLGLGFAAIGLTLLALLLTLRPPHEAGVVPMKTAAADHGLPARGDRESGFQPGLLRPPLILALILTCLLFAPSAFLWRLSGLRHLLTYPWQLLGLIGLCLSVVAGASVRLHRRLSSLPMLAGLIILTLLASYSYLQPRFTQHAPGAGPLQSWNSYRLMLLDADMLVEIPPTAAGLSQPTPGRLPLADYGAPEPGDTLHLLITFQATRPFHRDLKLFVHLLDSSGQMVAQADPLAGAGADPDLPGTDYPTSRWDPGRLIVVDVPIVVPADAATGPYWVNFGLYDDETLARLPVDGGLGGVVILAVDGASSMTL